MRATKYVVINLLFLGLSSAYALGSTEPSQSHAEAIFDAKCGICHAPGRFYPGYMALKERGVPEPDLKARSDLQSEAIKIIVSRGLGRMPPLTPTYISTDDLDLVSRWLTRKH